MKVLEYDPDEDWFSDGCHTDWFLWEPVATMHVASESIPPQPLSAEHWDAQITLPSVNAADTTMKLFLPVERHGFQCRSIRLPVELTVRELFTAIHAFYATPVAANDLFGLSDPEFSKRMLCNDMFVDYVKQARAALAAGKRVTWSDLLGPRDVLFQEDIPYSCEAANRRDPFECRGLVRYEGITQRRNRVYLVLGS
ncbi:MAG: hypothetical protein WDW38_002066 [Sanguina aurantia]